MDEAIEQVKMPDSFYLVPCEAPAVMNSDELDDVIRHFDSVYDGYADCLIRHNNLILQIGESVDQAVPGEKNTEKK